MASCVVGRCTTPRDRARRCYWHGEALGAFLVLCQGHQFLLMDEWVPLDEPASFRAVLAEHGDGQARRQKGLWGRQTARTGDQGADTVTEPPGGAEGPLPGNEKPPA